MPSDIQDINTWRKNTRKALSGLTGKKTDLAIQVVLTALEGADADSLADLAYIAGRDGSAFAAGAKATAMAKAKLGLVGPKGWAAMLIGIGARAVTAEVIDELRERVARATLNEAIDEIRGQLDDEISDLSRQLSQMYRDARQDCCTSTGEQRESNR